MIAVLCAIRQEISPLAACMDVSKKFDKGEILFYQGDMNGRPITLVQGGIGRENAKNAARCLLDSTKVDLLISAGVAGGIRQGLNVGDLLVAERVGYTGQNDFESEELQLKSNYVCKEEIVKIAKQFITSDLDAKIHFGNLLTVDKVIDASSTKRKIGEQNSFLAVEMESAAVAEVANEKGVGFSAIRSISDDIDDNLHLDYDNVISEEGKVKVTSVALSVLKNPQKLAQLSRLNRQTKAAAKSLALFLSKLIPLI